MARKGGEKKSICISSEFKPTDAVEETDAIQIDQRNPNRRTHLNWADRFVDRRYRVVVPPPRSPPAFFSVGRAVGTDCKRPRWLHIIGGLMDAVDSKRFRRG